MTETKRFSLGKEPFIRKADNQQSTKIIMRDFTIALIPLILFGWIKNGLLPFINGDTSSILTMLYPLFLVFIGGFTCWLLEFIYFKFFVKAEKVFQSLEESFPIIPGLILGMIVSVNTPLWILILGCVFATVIGKLIFGGFGRNIFNPALVGYVFINMAYAGVIMDRGGALNPTELEVLAGVTPLANFASNPIASPDLLIGPYGNLWNFFIGTMPGMLAETSAMLCIVAFVWLLVRKVINWRIPVIYVGTVFVLTYLIGAFHGYAGDLRYALFGILSGGLMFGAVFMATEPVTSPKSPNGKIIFALGLAFLTVLFRFKSNLPEGVGTAIMTMNLFTVIIDQIAAKARVSREPKRLLTTYGLIALLFLGIGSYTVSTTFAKTDEPDDEVTIELATSYQDFYTFEYVYEFLVDEADLVVVMVSNDYEILSINQPFYDTEDFQDEFLGLINSNKMQAIITNVEEAAGIYTLTIVSTGYKSPLTNVVTLDAEYKIASFVTDASPANESYDVEYNEAWNGEHPSDVIPPQIITNQQDLDQVVAVTGATVTSNALVEAARLALDYVKVVIKGEILDTNAELSYRSKAQDFTTLNFVYTFAFGRNQVNVSTDSDYEIVSFDNAYFDTDAFKATFNDVISRNAFTIFIDEVSEVGGIYTIVAKSFGYKSLIAITIVLDATYAFDVVTIDASSESYNDPYNETWNGESPSAVLPSRILANQDDLDAVEGITGATVTVRGVMNGVEQIKQYVSEVLKNE